MRGTGAHNVVIAGGLNWAYDLSGLPTYRLDGYNIVYATHLYPFPGKLPDDWYPAFGFLRRSVPLIVSEFGPVASADPTCPLEYVDEVLTYAAADGVHWTAWAWFASNTPGEGLAWCDFPAMFYAEAPNTPVYATTPYGAQIQAALWP